MKNILNCSESINTFVFFNYDLLIVLKEKYLTCLCSNSIVYIPLLPQIPVECDFVKQKWGIMGGSTGKVAHLQAAVCYHQNKGKSELHKRVMTEWTTVQLPASFLNKYLSPTVWTDRKITDLNRFSRKTDWSV